MLTIWLKAQPMKSMNWNSATGRSAGKRGAKGRSDDGGFRNRCVDYALRTEAIDQAISHFEGSAVNSDVFSDTEDGRIAFHFLADTLAYGFEICQLRHVGFLFAVVTSNAPPLPVSRSWRRSLS